LTHTDSNAMDRLFVAVHLSPDASASLGAWADKLKPQASFRKWVHPQDYHITVQFLGDTPRERIPELTEGLSAAAAEHAPFTLGVHEAGVFGASVSPRILWAGIRGDVDALAKLQRSVVSRMETYGFVPEDRPYRPHITIARKFQGDEKFSMDIIGSPPVNIQWDVHELVLFRTNLHATPMYEIVGVARLSRNF